MVKDYEYWKDRDNEKEVLERNNKRESYWQNSITVTENRQGINSKQSA